jgi:hypothetical protein
MTELHISRRAVLLSGLAGIVGATVGVPAALRTSRSEAATLPLVGAASRDWKWFDAACGPAQIYRVFDGGFTYATWQQTAAYRAHPNATAFDYSIHVLPQRLTDPTDPINAQIASFLATTPKNIIITNFHEPDNKHASLFTPAQYRAGLAAFANLVRAQNALDGGTRMTSLILMGITYGGSNVTKAIDWWPTDLADGGHVDIAEVDVYNWKHGGTAIPPGYTDGINWRSAKAMLTPSHNFAVAQGAQWAVAEIGMLEDVTNPMHKTTELQAALSLATTYGAQHINYFDTPGPTADWRLRYSTPVGTVSMTSNAALAWKAAMGN